MRFKRELVFLTCTASFWKEKLIKWKWTRELLFGENMLFTASRLNWPVQCSAARWVYDESVSRDKRDICCPRFKHGCLAFTGIREMHASWFESIIVNCVNSSIANDLILDMSDIFLKQIKTRWSGIGVTIGRPLGQRWDADSWTEAVCFKLCETSPTLAPLVSRIRICVGRGTPWRSRHEQELLFSAVVWLKTSDPFDPVSFDHLYLCHMRPGTEEPASTGYMTNE